MLLIGGHRSDFLTIQEIYQLAIACGVGQCTIVLPDSLRPLLPALEDLFFVASSPSGSIGKAATGELMHIAEESDCLSVGASLSNNSETAVVIDRLLTESNRPRCIYLDGLDIVAFNPKLATERANCCLIVTMHELLKLAGKLGVYLNIHSERGLLGRVELVQSVTEAMQASLVCIGKELIIVSGAQTSVTPDISSSINSTIYAALSVFWTQKQNFEHLTTAAFIIQQVSISLGEQQNTTVMQTAKIIEKLLINF